jgi:small-conductance mechanosensitive channel
VVQAQTLLTKVQAPVELFYRVLDRWLVQRLHAGPALLWGVHFLVSVAITLFLAWLLGALAKWLSRRLDRRGNPLAAALLTASASPLRWVVLLAGLADAVEDAWPAVKGPARWIAGTLFVLAVILGVRGLIALFRLAVELLLKPRLTAYLARGSGLDAEADDEAAVRAYGTYGTYGTSAQAMIPLMQRLAGLLLWLAGLILVLDHFGQNVSSVVAALGVTSLAIGLASQQALSNIIAGLVLVLDHPFRVGDRIRLPGLDGGEVLEIGMRSTHIRLSDGSRLIVPNADLVAARLVNQSTDLAVRAEVRLTVPITLPVEELSTFLQEAALAVEPAPLAEQPPRVQLLTVTDKADLALIVWLPRDADVPRIEENLRRLALRQIQLFLQRASQPAPPPPPPAPTEAAPPAPGAEAAGSPQAPPSSGPRVPASQPRLPTVLDDL